MDHHEKTVRFGEKAGVGESLSHFLPKAVMHSEPLKISSNPSFQAPGLAKRFSRCQEKSNHQQDDNDPGGNNPHQLMRAATGESNKEDRAGEQKCAAPFHTSRGWNRRTRRLLEHFCRRATRRMGLSHVRSLAAPPAAAFVSAVRQNTE